MTYQMELPKVFPWRLQSTRTTIRFMVRQLINPQRYIDDPGAPNGTSFAITTDAPEGQWNLWLSEASKDYLVRHMPHLANTLIETRYDVE